MLKKVNLLLVLLIFIYVSAASAGLVWKSNIVSKTDGKAATIEAKYYAQDGNVRQEFVKGTMIAFAKEGSYILYKKDVQTMYIVNPVEKTYMELPLDALGGMMSQFMTIDVEKVKVTKLEPETVLTYKCNHIKIETSYAMKSEMVKMESRVEQTQEVWGTFSIPTEELSAMFLNQSFKTGIKDLDEAIAKQMSAIKDVGFPIKTITVTKSTSSMQKGESTSVMEASFHDISKENVDKSLFDVPKNYKKTELFSSMTGMNKK